MEGFPQYIKQWPSEVIYFVISQVPLCGLIRTISDQRDLGLADQSAIKLRRPFVSNL